MRHRLRWLLLSPDGEEERSGLSFGQFDEHTAMAHACRVASPPAGYTLQVFLDGQLIEPQRPALSS